jgi:uncharacterized HAD superfamily protein
MTHFIERRGEKKRGKWARDTKKRGGVKKSKPTQNANQHKMQINTKCKSTQNANQSLPQNANQHEIADTLAQNANQHEIADTHPKMHTPQCVK